MQSGTVTGERQAILGALEELKKEFSGEILSDYPYRLLFATDASAYREVPLAVARPRDTQDIRRLILFAGTHAITLIPRTAGTSLAGQVVGDGIVVDVSRYMTRILEVNAEERWVRVEPGVILDELNQVLEPLGLFFGPETSTSNRCMIGGMVGNNSCGAHSLVYGSTRDHTLEIKALLSDGSEAVFGPLSNDAFDQRCELESLEGVVYRNIRDILANPVNQRHIREEYPDPRIHRRNTGYALDLLLNSGPFSPGAPAFNFCTLLAGSEGTLAFTTEVKLGLVPLPPRVKGLLCVHFEKLQDAFRGNLTALEHQPVAIELMDKTVLELTKNNIEQRQNRFFVEGEPEAILIVEFVAGTEDEVRSSALALEQEMRRKGQGYHFPLIMGKDIPKVWKLRKAGLGVLSNMAGDAKPVAVIEDTAVHPELLPDYLADFQQLLDKHELKCVYYAHIATGELHLRPVLNLKDPAHVELFYTIALETARLVKKYRGSLSGEHGDGRLRGQFIPLMLGETVYGLIRNVKNTWDPAGIFNAGKITDTPPMHSSLRYAPGHHERQIHTYFDFTAQGGLLRALEQCNGSGDCRKTELSGGTMCPSYMGTREEHTTTRARANILREFLTHSPKQNPFDHAEAYEVLDLCLSCKGCKSECPSNVDMARYKAEFLQHYYDSNGLPLRTRMIANIAVLNRWGSLLPGLYNQVLKNPFLMSWFKRVLSIASQRSLPPLSRFRLSRWVRRLNRRQDPLSFPNGQVWLFADEFTEYNDAEIGRKAVLLLNALGYYVSVPGHYQSGRAYLSKGLVRKAARLAGKNVDALKGLVNPSTPLIGIEPSGILTFRDEYPDLVEKDIADQARELASACLLFEEFIQREMQAGRIRSDQFTTSEKKIKLHGHCHQKALSSTLPTRQMLEIPVHYQVEEIPSGCCGMAGSFGYESEHYELSMKIGGLVLFPAVKASAGEYTISAPGTSCRHQIKDGTGIDSFHPIEILYDALVDPGIAT